MVLATPMTAKLAYRLAGRIHTPQGDAYLWIAETPDGPWALWIAHIGDYWAGRG